ncbi:MAG: hypothetical protein BGO21_10355 [Dyadobacter sp. 50-39]|nr:MAG: hypothetical protein BGO21_10355 [Dyadobacter sp. 50-39]
MRTAWFLNFFETSAWRPFLTASFSWQVTEALQSVSQQLGVALGTISFQGIKAALVNPVKSLRSK